MNTLPQFSSRSTAEEHMTHHEEARRRFHVLARPLPPRLAMKVKGKIVFIDPAHVLTVRSEGNYVAIECESGAYLLRGAISNIAEVLAPYGFIRIHRSALVNASLIEEIAPLYTGDYSLRMKDGRRYKVTRTYKSSLHAIPAAWIGTEGLVDSK